MADKDVRLIIRAKNEASRAIDSVSKALTDLDKNQKKAGESAGKADSLLGSLGEEFQRLTREANGLGALNRVASQIDRVTSAIARIEGEAKQAADNLTRFQTEANAAAESTQRLKSQVGGLEAELKKQQRATDAAREARTKANREVRKAETAYARLQKQIEKQGRGPAARSASVFVGADISAARQAAAAAGAAFEAQRGKQEAAKTSLSGLNTEIRRSEANQHRLGKEVRDTSAAVEQSSSALTKAKESLAEIQSVGNRAAGSLGKVAVSEKEISEASAKVDADLARVRAQMEAIQRFSTGGGGFADPKTAAAMRNQRAEMEKTEASWRTLQDEARRLAAEMRAVAQPTQQQVAAFRQVTAAAAAAKTEYRSQQSALHGLQGTTKATFAAFAAAQSPLRATKRNLDTTKQSADAVNASLRRMSGAGGLRGIFGGIYGESRKAMSVLQRMRGEVLSLTTAYFGLYGAISSVGGVIKAYQSLEAAQNRLGAVFDQNQTRISGELDYLARQASRLGISFDVLSRQYSKFTVAASAANFESEATRKIFLSVAEAGRVNKLSLEEMSGIFLALEQMISKGKVTSEELRRQLGDRLPGAFNIMADALGVTTAELDAMMKAGEVFSDQTTILKFADQLDKRFGSQLSEALKSTTTELGKFQNELFQAQLRVARGGFIEAFTEGMRELNEFFRSREGHQFFLSLGATLGKFVSVLAQVPKYFDLIGDAIKLLIALRVGRWVASLATGFATLRTRLVAAQAGMVAARAQMSALRGAAMSAAAGVRALGFAFGGWVGVAASFAAFIATDLIAKWASGVKGVTSLLEENERVMQKILTAYEDAIDKTGEWTKELAKASTVQLATRIAEAGDELDKLRESARRPDFTPFRGFEGGNAGKELDKLVQKFQAGTLDAEEFKIAVNDLAEANPEINSIAVDLLDLADAVIEGEESIEKLEAALRLIQGTASDADRALLGVGDAASESGEGFDGAADAANRYKKSLEGIMGLIPDLEAQLKSLKDQGKLDEFVAGLGFGPRTQEQQGLINEAQLNIDLNGVARELHEAVKLIVSKEGFIDTAEWDENHFRVGYGSDTMTKMVDGIQKVVEVTENSTVTRAEAMDDLARRIVEFQNGIKRDLGLERWNQFTEKQQAVLTSLAYNYGRLTETGIIATLKTGDTQEIADAIRSLASHNDGINAGRRRSEAAIFEQNPNTDAIIRAEERITEERLKQNEATQQTISDNEFRIQQQQLIEAGKAREAEIEEAIRAAKAENPEITGEQLARIRETTAALWDQEHALDAVKLKEEEVNRLTETRQQLMQQIEYFQGQGDVSRAEQAKEQLEGINGELDKAIEKAIAMWRAIGGSEADLAILRLQNAGISVRELGREVVITKKELATMLTEGIVGAFKSFAQNVAEGKNVFKSLGQAFREFAANFLLKIAEMIAQAIVFRLVMTFLNSMGLGGFSIPGAPVGVAHSGAVIGQTSTPMRMASPSWFSNAVRYHEGGMPGLKPGEVPAILRKGEIVDPGDGSFLSKLMAGVGGGKQEPPTIVNAIDSGDFVSKGMATVRGQKAIMNFIRDNSGAIRAEIGD